MNITKSEKNLYAGIGNCKVLAINPSEKALCEFMGWTYNPDSESNFTYVRDKDIMVTDSLGRESYKTVKELTIRVIVKELTTMTNHEVKFRIIDTDDLSNKGDKIRFINQHGGYAWADSESNLPDWFTSVKIKEGTFKREVRVAKKGESDFFDFISKWTNLSKFKLANTVFPSDPIGFWKGDLSEYDSLVDNFKDHTVMCVFGIRTREDEVNGELIDSQDISTKFFCPGGMYALFNAYKEKDFEGLENNKKLYDLNKFITDIRKEEYGYSHYYVMDSLKPYDKTKNPIHSDVVVSSTPKF